MDTASAIAVIVGIILSFAGVIFAILGAGQRQVLSRIQTQADSNTNRIAYMERHNAARDQEIKQILKQVSETHQMLREHIEKSNRHE